MLSGLFRYLRRLLFSYLKTAFLKKLTDLEKYLSEHGTERSYKVFSLFVDALYETLLYLHWLVRNIRHSKRFYLTYGYYLSVYLDLDEVKYPPSKHFIQSLTPDGKGTLFTLIPTDIEDVRKNYYFYHFLRTLNANLFLYDTYLLFVVKLESKDYSHKLLSERRFYTATALTRRDFVRFSKRLLAFLKKAQKENRIVEIKIHFYNTPHSEK